MADILSSSIPKARKVSVKVVSAAISPQMAIHFPSLCMALAAICIIRSTAGWWGRNTFSTFGFCRSAARVNWIRSLVPMLKKSTSLARRSLIITAAGVSIIMPSSTHSAKGLRSASSSACTCFISSFTALISSTEVMSGSISARFP